MRCVNCDEEKDLLARGFGVCLDCIRDRFEGVRWRPNPLPSPCHPYLPPCSGEDKRQDMDDLPTTSRKEAQRCLNVATEEGLKGIFSITY